MESIGEILSRLMNSTVWGMLIKLNLLKYKWPDVVGENLAKVTKLEKIDGSEAIISVSSPVWASQIKYMESSIKKRINWYLGSNVIKKIKVSFNKNN
jgi:predicted nucleic acid-binding Zn ribbon protein